MSHILHFYFHDQADLFMTSTDMISIETYRCRIGNFMGRGNKGGKSKLKNQYSDPSAFNPYNRPGPMKFFNCDYSGSWSESIIHSPPEDAHHSLQITFYSYLMLMLIFVMLSIISSPIFLVSIPKSSLPYINFQISILCLMHIKIGYFCIISTVVLKYMCLGKSSFKYARKKYIGSSKFCRILIQLLLFILLINFLLIGIVNPSLLNPGPHSLKVCYQNVQGLIPFSQLDNNQPSLDRTKIFELNAYLNINKPDIVILNETWLKKSVQSSEIFLDPMYSENIFRNDRSQLSHPPDPTNHKKFRRNGGGVLIAIRSDIVASFKRLPVKKGAEILAVELTIDGKKFVFCTIYRVGTLGEPNHESIVKTIKTFYKARNQRKIFILGDLNLSSVTWPITEDSQITNEIDKLFVNSFMELGMYQCITEPTHQKNNTLDLLLTNSEMLISNINISPNKYLCHSDHYLISFEVKTNVKHKKVPKRKILNFKKANWDALNHDLSHTHWNAFIDCTEPEIAWSNFKNILFMYVKKHIPTITIKSNFSMPWFDSECYEAYRDKQRAHKKSKQNKNLQNELSFKSKRRFFNQICNKKMRDNLYNEEDPEIIKKSFIHMSNAAQNQLDCQNV